jgi:two-component system phosphate regulon sensor histidine kinase PhoR
MFKKYLYIILFIVAIIGLSYVQYQYFRIGLNLAGTQFNENMGDAAKEIKKELQAKNELTFLVGSAISKNDLSFRLSLDSIQDASIYFMDEFLKDKLLEHGIKTGYGFSLYGKDSTAYLSSKDNFTNEDKLLRYPIILEGYLPDLLGKRLILELQFENVNRYFLSQLNGLTIPSIIFLFIIIFVIVWVYRAFYLQMNLITTTNEFINNLTHELKTPVFTIGVATKILQEKGHEDEKELISMIRKQVDKLKGQIDKVLELGSIEGKRGFINREEVDLKPMLSELSSNFEQVSKLENFEFFYNLKGASYPVLADPYHLENAINSLLENARKYSKERPVIDLEAFIEGKHLIIKVRDRGIGISAQDLKKIFDKYYRVSDGDLHRVKGYGLGLNYVKRIVHLHKGKIEVESTVHEGSTFILKIPLLKNE